MTDPFPPVIRVTTWRGVIGPNDSVTYSMNHMSSAAYAYEVYDFHGLVAAGTSASTSQVVIPPPAGGWAYGTYQVYLPTMNVGNNFTVIDKTDARFPAIPATTIPADYSSRGYGDGIGTYDPVLRGVFGMGPERGSIADLAVTNPGDQTGKTAMRNLAQVEQLWYYSPTNVDPTHPREAMMSFSASNADHVIDYMILNDVGGTNFGNNSLAVYPASLALNGTQTFIGVTTGSASGFKLTVYAPNSSTAVETYDNLASSAVAETTINAASTRIKAFDQGRGGNPAPMAPAAFGRARRDLVATGAADLYADGVRWFEGPWNEPQNAPVAQILHEYKLWAGTVKLGAPQAKTMGPGAVSYNQHYQSWLAAFLAGVDRTLLDGISTHAYNTHNGDLRLARQTRVDLQQIIATAGLSDRPLWQTEQGVDWPYWNVNRGRQTVGAYMMFMLMMEQTGTPPERSAYWYDIENTFSLTVLVHSNGALHPVAPAFRTWMGERYGKTYAGALDFGTPGNDQYLGNIYTKADGSRSYAMVNNGPGNDGQVKFTVTGGAAPLARLDWAGNQTTIPIVGGVATVPVDWTPTYLRLPAGVTAAPIKLDYGANLALTATATASGGSRVVGGSTPALSRIVADGTWSSYYEDVPYGAGRFSPWQSASTAMPQTVTIALPAAQTANRAIVRAAPTYYDLTTLLDFDLQVSSDGSAFATVYTFTKDPAANYVLRAAHSENYPNGGLTVLAEQWDDEKFLWDVGFTARTVKAIRLNIRACTYGGAIDATTNALVVPGNSGPPYPTLTAVQLYNSAAVAAPAAGNPYVVRTIT